MAKLDLQPVERKELDLRPVEKPNEGAFFLPGKLHPRVSPVAFKKVFGGIAESKVGRGIGVGLGVAFWPFKKAEQIMATPLEKLAEPTGALYSAVIENAMHRGAQVFGLLPDDYQYEPDSVPRNAWEVAKSYARIPGGIWSGIKGGKEAKTFEDYFSGYWEGYTGQEPPKGYAVTAGMGASFLATPAAVGGTLRTIGGVRKIGPIKKAIEARKIPLWMEARLRSKARIGAGIEKARELGKSLGKKDAARLAKEINRQTGLNVSPQTVQLRVGQLIKGGITTRPELAARANPIIQEFQQNSKALQKLGILGEELYTVKLPRKRISQLIVERTKLQSQLIRLDVAPHKETLAKLTKGLKIKGKESITARLWNLANTTSKNEAAYVDKLGQILGVKTKEPAKLMRMVEQYSAASSRERGKIIDELWSLGDKAMGQKVSGIKPLMKRIESMKRTFPGKAKRAGELQGKMDAITRKIQTSYKEGGTGYFPRMYASKEAELMAKKFPGYSAKRIRAHYAKARKPISEEARRALGEIKRPEYPVTKRLIQEASDIETGRLFNVINRIKGWTSVSGGPGFKQLPESKGFGVLSGKFVKNKIYDDIVEMKRFRSNFEAWYDSMIGTWKAGKVLWNPATHARNMISNSILLDLSGMGHGEQMKYMTRAVSEMRNNSREYQFAKRHFARTTLAHGELLDDMLKGTKETGSGMEKFVNAVPNFIRKTSAGPASVYQKEEFVFKFLKYLQQRDLGKRPIQAVREANKWLFDYSELSQFERRVARRVMPFYTFPRKAIPVIIEAAATRPHTLAKYPLMAWAMEKHSLSRLEMTEKDYAQVKKIMPEYMKSGSYILMPYRDNNGDLRFLDWTYLIPWGTITELQERGPLDVFVANPLVQAVGDLKRNRDAFTGREIWQETDTDAEKFYKRVEHIWRIASPSLAPKGLYWDKLYESATGKPDVRPRPFPETVAHTILGLRTQAIDEEEQYTRFLREKRDNIEELEGKLIRIEFEFSDGKISESEYKKRQKRAYQQIDKVLEELD